MKIIQIKSEHFALLAPPKNPPKLEPRMITESYKRPTPKTLFDLGFSYHEYFEIKPRKIWTTNDYLNYIDVLCDRVDEFCEEHGI